jgi:hypothetical protein
MTHGFADQLAYSHSQADEPWWDQVYAQAFPDMATSVDLRHDGWHQKAGRDRAIVLTSGRALYVDEKVRKEDYPDILVEVWSVYPKDGQPPYSPPVPPVGVVEGWARKALDCDYIAYALAPSQVCYLLPFPSLRAAVQNNLRGWIDLANRRVGGYRWVVAPNSRYDTIGIAVPPDDLTTAMTTSMTVRWGEH